MVMIACARPTPALALGPADGPGCLGVNVAECVRWLRATMVVDESFLAEAMARRHQVDVNGRPLNDGLVTVYARLPDRMEQFVILLHLRPDDAVRRIETNVPGDLLHARTETTYDASGFYEIVWRLLGRRCPGLVKLDLYRFFENAVKPRVKVERHDFPGGLFALHRITSHASGVPYCGANFSYTNLLQWRGTKELEAAQKGENRSFIELR
jgi:hypothetical protein